MRKVHITQKQLEECMMCLNELTLNGDESLNAKNGDVKSAAQATIDDAQRAGVNTTQTDTSVSFSADSLRNKSGITEKYNVFTKKQIKEARLQNLLKKSTEYTKKDLKKRK